MRPKLCARVPAYFTTICATAIHNAAAATKKAGSTGTSPEAAANGAASAGTTAAAVLRAAPGDVRGAKDQAAAGAAPAAGAAAGSAAAAAGAVAAAKAAAKASRSGRILAQAKLDELLQGQPPLPPTLRGAMADAGAASPALLDHLDSHHLAQVRVCVGLAGP
jgi:hypothetical protein